MNKIREKMYWIIGSSDSNTLPNGTLVLMYRIEVPANANNTLLELVFSDRVLGYR